MIAIGPVWTRIIGLLAVSVACSTTVPAAESTEVTFRGEGGLELRGTLTRPEGDSASGLPAVLLLPGSGPTDRDGNARPYVVTDLLKQIAERLASEPRFIGYSIFRVVSHCETITYEWRRGESNPRPAADPEVPLRV